MLEGNPRDFDSNPDEATSINKTLLVSDESLFLCLMKPGLYIGMGQSSVLRAPGQVRQHKVSWQSIGQEMVPLSLLHAWEKKPVVSSVCFSTSTFSQR